MLHVQLDKVTWLEKQAAKISIKTSSDMACQVTWLEKQAAKISIKTSSDMACQVTWPEKQAAKISIKTQRKTAKRCRIKQQCRPSINKSHFLNEAAEFMSRCQRYLHPGVKGAYVQVLKVPILRCQRCLCSGVRGTYVQVLEVPMFRC